MGNDVQRCMKVPLKIEECENERIRLPFADEDKSDNEDEYDYKLRRGDLKVHDPHHEHNKQERCNAFLKNLALQIAQRNEKITKLDNIYLDGLYLDDWKPLLTTLHQNDVRLLEFKLENCYLTERGALILDDALRRAKERFWYIYNNKKGFSFDHLTLSSLKGSLEWFDGLNANSSISKLHLFDMPLLYSAMRLMEGSKRFESIWFGNLKAEEESKEEEILCTLDTLRTGKNQNDAHTLEIKINEKHPKLPLELCQGIGRLLLSEKYGFEGFKLENRKGLLPYDFLKDALRNCLKLELVHSDFDPLIVSYFIQKDPFHHLGGSLHLEYLNDITSFERLLQLVDLSVLGKFELVHDGNEWMDLLCRHLATNKGPKRLEINIKTASLTKLAASLVSNDKIEHLEVRVGEEGNGPEERREFVRVLHHRMPRLESWKLNIAGRYWRREIKMREQWDELTCLKLESNWGVRKIRRPRFRESLWGSHIQEIMNFNKGGEWKNLICQSDELPIGIWSLALGRMQTVYTMFNILCEVPHLFQQVADAASERKENQYPSFEVPHHPNCPGCHKRRKSRHDDQQGTNVGI